MSPRVIGNQSVRHTVRAQFGGQSAPGLRGTRGFIHPDVNISIPHHKPPDKSVIAQYPSQRWPASRHYNGSGYSPSHPVFAGRRCRGIIVRPRSPMRVTISASLHQRFQRQYGMGVTAPSRRKWCQGTADSVQRPFQVDRGRDGRQPARHKRFQGGITAVTVHRQRHAVSSHSTNQRRVAYPHNIFDGRCGFSIVVSVMILTSKGSFV